MPVTQTSSGDNSAFIEYTAGSTYTEILTEVQTFLVAHGWTKEDASFWDAGSNKCVMTYKAVNKDATTYKYIQIGYYDTTGYSFYCKVYEGYNSTTKIGTNLAYYSDNHALWSQAITLASHNGRLHLFASERYFFMLNIGTVIGSSTGNGGIGCFEFSVANDGDNTPHFAWMNSYLATSNYKPSTSYSNYYVLCPPRTAKYTGAQATYYNRMCTPIGHWGGEGVSTTNYFDMNGTIPSNPPPFGATVKHHVFDIIASFDNTTNRYVKGKMFGLKAFTTNIGANGDIFRVACDSDMFLDNGGTDLDHFIIKQGTYGSFGIPL